MKSLKELFIEHVVGEAVGRAAGSRAPRVMDLGCGTASYVPALMKRFPNLEYVGVEPIASSYEAAEKNTKDVPNAKVHFQLAYDSVPQEKEGSFDLVFSLSVLEHVKNLPAFIDLSVRYVKQGGILMHRYDLGHALSPHSFKERLHVWFGNNFPQVLPERQFVRYVDSEEVERLYRDSGVTPTKVTYHQMRSHKEFEKYCKDSETTAVNELFAWEVNHQAEISNIPRAQRENLFPAVAVYGRRD